PSGSVATRRTWAPPKSPSPMECTAPGKFRPGVTFAAKKPTANRATAVMGRRNWTFQLPVICRHQEGCAGFSCRSNSVRSSRQRLNSAGDGVTATPSRASCNAFWLCSAPRHPAHPSRCDSTSSSSLKLNSPYSRSANCPRTFSQFSSCLNVSLIHFSQGGSHFLGCPEQTILSCFLSGAQHFANLPQTHSLVVPQLEHHALARRQLSQRVFHALPDLPAEQTSERVAFDPGLRRGIGAVQSPFRSGHNHGLLFANLSFAQLIQAQVRRNPVQPGVEAAIEAEMIQVAVHPQERFLVHIPGIFG